MYGNDIAVLDAEIVAYDTIHPCATIIEVVVRQHDEDCIFSLLALDKDGVAAEQL